ncbi:hypothetical protein GC173_17515 [bacterium]|nr:hypothetical protein [bacterium]
MTIKPARDRFTPAEITAILQRNVELFKDEPNFAPYFTQLTMYLLDSHYDEGRISGVHPPPPPRTDVPELRALQGSPAHPIDLRVFLPQGLDELPMTGDDFDMPTAREMDALPDPDRDPRPQMSMTQPAGRTPLPLPSSFPGGPRPAGGPQQLPITRTAMPPPQGRPQPPVPGPPPAPPTAPLFTRPGTGPSQVSVARLPSPSVPPPAAPAPRSPIPSRESPPRIPNVPPDPMPSPSYGAPTGRQPLAPPPGPLGASRDAVPRLPLPPQQTPPPYLRPPVPPPVAIPPAPQQPASARFEPAASTPGSPGGRPVSVNSRSSGVFQMPNAPLLTPLGDTLREPHPGREEPKAPVEGAEQALGKKTQVYRVVRPYRSPTALQSPCPVCGVMVPMEAALCPGCGQQVH